MQEPEELNPVDREFELALRQINPAETGIDRGEFAFQLGRASAQRRLKSWRIASGVLMAALLFSLIMPLATPFIREHSVAAQPESLPPDVNRPLQEIAFEEADPIDAPAYLNARIAVLENGVMDLDEFFAPLRSTSGSADSDHSDDFRSVTARSLSSEWLN